MTDIGLIGFMQHYVVAFLLVLTALVFVHEFGHFWIARLCGVRVEVFSIGFGPEIFGWHDKHGTRWRLSWIPLGGYVKFFGDANAASKQDDEAMADLSEEDKAGVLHYKPLWQRAAVVAAGPFANFLFAALLFMGLFMAVGKPEMPNGVVVGTVKEHSAAAGAGLQVKDRIARIDGKDIEGFADLRNIVMGSAGKRLEMVIERNDREQRLVIVPKPTEWTDAEGNTRTIGLIGVTQAGPEYRKLGPWDAFTTSWVEVVTLSGLIFEKLGELVSFQADMEEFGGPVKIAQMSGQVSQIGIVALVGWTAMLSVNLGLINLLPIPVLDGGHLLFYAYEAVFRKPPGQKIQELGFSLGLALVLSLFVVLTFNDIGGPELIEKMRNLF